VGLQVEDDPGVAQDHAERLETANAAAIQRFENKIEIAKAMLERAFEADVPARWVEADSFYGRGPRTSDSVIHKY
jgi:SRSO17 transposase